MHIFSENSYYRIRETDFNAFLTNSQEYLTSRLNIASNRNGDYHIGDEVIVIKPRGDLANKKNTEYYTKDINITKLPIGSTGIITNLKLSEDQYQVNFPKLKNSYWVIAREIDSTNLEYLSQINSHLNSIKTHVQEIKNKK